MMLDAIGAEQIRDAFTTAADTAGEHAGDVADLAGALGMAAEVYAALSMAASTLGHLRDAAAGTATAQASLGTAGECLLAALADFDARDGRVAEAVAGAGNLMRAEGYGESFPLPGTATTGAVRATGAAAPVAPVPVLTAGQARKDLEDIINGRRWLTLSQGDPAWRPSPSTPELLAQLAADDRAEDDGADGADRTTCHTHQSWFADCIGDPSHSNPVTGYNWCPQHRCPVQICRCRPATVDGTPPYTVPSDGGAGEGVVSQTSTDLVVEYELIRTDGSLTSTRYLPLPDGLTAAEADDYMVRHIAPRAVDHVDWQYEILSRAESAQRAIGRADEVRRASRIFRSPPAR